MKQNLFVTTTTLLLVVGAYGQAGYQQNNLVGNTPGTASKIDPQLSNPWGIAIISGQPVWIANNNSGTSTLYSSDGTKDSLVVQIPTAANNPCNPGCPTGIVANTTSDFGGASFIFDTEDGLIVSWIQGTTAFISVDNSGQGAIYKDLRLLSGQSGHRLLAANFHTGKIEVYDGSFHPTNLAGNFTDPNLPAGFAPFSIHVLGNSIYVAYALKDPNEGPSIGLGSGIVNIFDTNGNFLKRLVTGGNAVNAPWGIAIAPANFGQFSNDILIGNFGDGFINAFDNAGNFLGQLKDGVGNPLVNPGLWELAFGIFGDPQKLYFTAGGADEAHGTFGTIVAAQSTGTGDFSLTVSPNSVMTGVGGSGTVTVTASGLNGFSGNIGLACSGLPTGVTCAFSPSSLNPGTGTASSSLTISVAQGYSFAALVGPGASGLFLLGFALIPLSGAGAGRKSRARVGGVVLMAVVGMLLLIGAGCGGSMGNHTPKGNNMITVTGAAGSIAHSAQLSLTVN